MFSTPVLDVALVLFFTYLLVAVIASTINEVFTGLLKMRAKMLKTTIVNMINDQKWKEFADEIIKSPLINSLQRKNEIFPSYIPPEQFVEAVKYAADVKGMFEVSSSVTIKEGDENNPVMKMFKVFSNSSQTVEEFENKIENLFNGAMDRLNGWYKRRIYKIILVISFVTVIALNVDTVNIVTVLWNNPENTKAAADKISVLLESKDTTNVIYTYSDSTLSKIKKINEVYALLEDQSFPVGWGDKFSALESYSFWDWITKILGILLTTLAAALGAPFWFDMLNKLVNLRATGKRPGK